MIVSVGEEEIESFAETGFAYFGFILKFNDHGSVESVLVDSVEVTDIYGLEIVDSSVKAEAAVTVRFTADFEYDDYDTAFYDCESDTWFFLRCQGRHKITPAWESGSILPWTNAARPPCQN